MCQRAAIASTMAGSVVPVGPKTRVIGLVRWIGEIAANAQPMVCIILTVVQHGQTGPVKPARPFGSFTHGELVPILGVKQTGFDCCHRHPFASIRGHDFDWLIASDCQNIAIVVEF